MQNKQVVLMVDPKSYVIEVICQGGDAGYVYETSSYGKKHLDAPACLTSSKKCKTFEGVQKNKDRSTIEGRVVPNDDTLSSYLLALSIVKSAVWSDMAIEQVIQVASIIQKAMI